MLYCIDCALFLGEQPLFCFCNFYSFSVLLYATFLQRSASKKHELILLTHCKSIA